MYNRLPGTENETKSCETWRMPARRVAHSET